MFFNLSANPHDLVACAKYVYANVPSHDTADIGLSASVYYKQDIKAVFASLDQLLDKAKASSTGKGTCIAGIGVRSVRHMVSLVFEHKESGVLICWSWR